MSSRNLFWITVAFFILPNLLFLANWIDPTFSVVSIIGLLLSYFFILKTQVVDLIYKKIPYASLLVIGIISIGVVIFTGTGGLFAQGYDFWGHNAKLTHLYIHSWPAVLIEAKTYYAYYFGFYLPISGAAKVFGGHLLFFNFTWICFGIFLALCWLFMFFDQNFTKLFLAFTIATPSIGLLNTICNGFYLPNVFVGYSLWLHDFFRGIQWEPHQLIPSAICASFLLFETKFSEHKTTLLLFIPISLIFSPFLTMSMAAYYMLITIGNFELYHYATIKQNIRYLSWLVLIGILVIPIVVYFMSNNVSNSIVFAGAADGVKFFVSYFIFVFFNILVFSFCILNIKTSFLKPKLIVTITILLLIIPLFRLGVYNDILIKTALFPILMLYYSFAEVLYNSLINRKIRYIYLAIYLVSFSGTVSIVIEQFKNYNFSNWKITKNTETHKPFDAYDNIDKMLKEKFSEKEALQYRGNMNSIYAKYFAKSTLQNALKLEK